jgi:2',3'-cyclic-nucleotide 2'-phosphodiesterase (5'-nucleotidase family)
MIRISSLFFTAILSVLISCRTTYQPAKVTYLSKDIVRQTARIDSTMLALLEPFKDSLDTKMSKIVVMLGNDLEKKQPQGTLGDMIADAMRMQAEKVYGKKVDVALMNSGGIRLPSVQTGIFTLGKLYEVHPFDNRLLIMSLSGDILQQLLDLTASRGGWPVSGMSMVIRDKKATDIMIQGAPLEKNRYYVVALSDYVAGGGDDAYMLKGLPLEDKNYLLRNAIGDYLGEFRQAGKSYYSVNDQRVKYAQ